MIWVPSSEDDVMAKMGAIFEEDEGSGGIGTASSEGSAEGALLGMELLLWVSGSQDSALSQGFTAFTRRAILIKSLYPTSGY